MPTIKTLIESAIKELEFAKYDTTHCPAKLHTAEYRKYVGDLEHTDSHIDNAISLLQDALNKGGVW